jgi:hypothetical protein
MKTVALLFFLICMSSIAWSDNIAISTTYPTNPTPSAGLISRVTPQVSFIMSDYQGSSVNSLGTTPNYGFGATLETGRTQLALETGLLYRAFGAQYQGAGYNFTIHNGYVAVPIIGKFYFSDPSGNSLYVKGGVVPGYLVNKGVTSNNAPIDTTNLPLNYFEFEAAVGVGDKIPLSQTTDLMLELTYNRGYTNIISDNDATAFNEAFILTAGFTFDL